MFRSHDMIPSKAMGRRVHLWRYGHFGPPLVVFPSASGMAHEWDSHGMVEALGDWLEAGKLKLYCTESNVAEAWTRKQEHPALRIKRHQAFENYVVSELVDYIREDCGSEDIPLAASGTSLGALYAANFALKFPAVFRYALCLSGRYDVNWLTDGFSNEDIYFNNPMAYVAQLNGEHLDRVRDQTHLTLVCGQGQWEDGNIEETHAFADLLDSKGISHKRDLWGREVSHEWVWWRRQARFHIEQSLL
jgi:esterase/lipase superfamily enzyme